MDQSVRKHIVISAVNIRKGGTLTVLRDCLGYLSSRPDLHVTALVHERSLCGFPGIDYIEIPWSTGSWLRRLWCEYHTMHGISLSFAEPADLWFSLHDTSPRVLARRQAVYCHTSFPFMRATWQDVRMDYKIALFSLFTRYAYRIHVRRNRYLVVQQQWMRERLSRLVGFPAGRIVVAPPAFGQLPPADAVRDVRETVFLYPATPDCHKNIETLCRASALLEKRVGCGVFRTVLTINGKENKYAGWLYGQFGRIPSIDFRGYMTRGQLAGWYGKAACLVFPSRVETWGLPISEFLPTGKAMLLADLPYARETASGADLVSFFPPTDAETLAGRMEALLRGDLSSFGPVPPVMPEAPCVRTWAELFDLLLND